MSTGSPIRSRFAAPAAAREMTPLSAAELRRRAWHILPGLLPFLLWLYPHRDPISPTLQFIILGFFAGLVAGIWLHYGRIARRGETQSTKVSAIAGYAGSVLLMLAIFPGDIELGLTVLAILAFGDGTATLAGNVIRSPKLPWNAEKTWAGTFGFLIGATLLSAIVYWGETHNLEAAEPAVSFSLALMIVTLPVFASAIVESLRLRLNDNIRVGVVASASLIVMHTLLR